MEKSKKCTQCGRELPLSDFYKYSNRDRLMAKCKYCYKEYYKKYFNDKFNRAKRLLSGYRNADKKNLFGNVIDFDAQWIVDNIFTKPCVHCGETDWTKIGCNRLDNSKGHTKDNVEPCCRSCNSKLSSKTYTSQFRKNHYKCLY